jgi:hypothetical protein
MLIKSADDTSAMLAELEARSSAAGPDAKRATDELRRRRAGLKGEAESAYLIDFEFKGSSNWAVIHDLRIEQGGRTAQIDHLLINRFLDFYVLESKHFHAGLKINDDGEFLRWNDFKRNFEGMPSPLAQNDRHIAVLRDVVAAIELPSRLGMRMTPSFFSLVMVAPNARIDRSRRFDCSRVIKADQLRKTIDKDIDSQGAGLLLKAAARMVASETVMDVAKRIADRHVPAPTVSPSRIAEPRAEDLSNAPSVPSPSIPSAGAADSPATAIGPSCKACSGTVGSILYGKYGYYFQCNACQTNTAIRLACQPGHKPRLRKAGMEFFQDCPSCADSRRYFVNG